MSQRPDSQRSEVRPRNPKSETRLTILHKAYQMYVAGQLEPGDEKLSVVLQELGYTTGAGYQIWDNQAAFREDLKVYVAENIDYAIDSLNSDYELAVNLKEPFEQQVLVAGDQFIAAFTEQEGFYLTLRFFAMGQNRPDAVGDALRRAYARSDEYIGEMFALVLGHYQRRVRAPYTMGDLTGAVTALVEGYALRHRVNAPGQTQLATIDGVERHMFSVGLLALARHMTEDDPTAA